MSEMNKGYLAAFISFFLWGASTIYFSELSNVSALEILAHRIVWSFIILLFLISISKYKVELYLILKNKKIMLKMFFVSLIIGINWFLFVYTVLIKDILQTSLGYFISPLISIIFGVLFFNETLSLSKKAAVSMVVLAIILQFYQINKFPIFALSLAFSFASYGAIKKNVTISPITSLFLEVLFVFPLAIIYLFYLQNNLSLVFLHQNRSTDILLLSAGIVTLTPLLFFSYAVKKIKLTVLGFFQYVGPTVSFLIAIFIYNEVLNMIKIITFIIVWLALFVFSFNGIKKMIKNN